MKKRAGFTLLELLVVVAVISFLATISVVALSVAQAKNRDAQRKLDQITIIKAASLYRNDVGVPPTQVQSVGVVSLLPSERRSVLAGIVPTASALMYDVPGEDPSGPPIPISGPGSGPGCTGTCGDGSKGSCEQCDCGPQGGFSPTCTASQLGNNSCTNLGYANPALGCSSGCRFVTTSCGAPICGDGMLKAPETCDSGPLNGTYPYCNAICTGMTPPPGNGQPGNPCGDGICNITQNETIASCPADCVTPGTSCTVNGVCNRGETPGSCPGDCVGSICLNTTGWDMCCLLGGTYCAASGGGGAGYYGVCNGPKCEQKYLMKKPAVTCTLPSDCNPAVGANGEKDKFVSDRAGNFMAGVMGVYAPQSLKDPGHKQGTYADDLNKYWVTSHPDIVGVHGLCSFVSFELEDNVNPYPDIDKCPTYVQGDLASCFGRWNVLCTD